MKSLVANKSRITVILGVLAIGLIVGLIGIFFAVRFALDAIMVKYTDPLPREMPVVEVTRGEIKQLKHKWTNFKEALKVGASSEKLELTSNELNVMLLTDEELNKFKGKVVLSIDHQNIVNALLAEDESIQRLQGNFYITVEDDRVLADISMPIKSLGLSDYGDRYVNATGELDISFVGSRLQVRMNPKEINGEQLPDIVLNRVRELDLYDMFVRDHPVYGRLGARIRSIEIKGDKIHLELTEGSGPLPSLARDANDRRQSSRETLKEIKDLRDSTVEEKGTRE